LLLDLPGSLDNANEDTPLVVLSDWLPTRLLLETFLVYGA
jgi:hypothetical protein